MGRLDRMERLIVLEVNELPPRVLEWWGSTHPDSALWQLAQRGQMADTLLHETLPRDLYPSQSWASVGMGVPWSEHGVFWYADPKPDRHPFYWQHAADAGRTVGLVGVLHSSTVVDRHDATRFPFVIPDVFSGEPATRPAELQPLQELNLRLSRQSARVAAARLSPTDLRGVLGFARHGVTPATWFELARLATAVGTRRWNKERLRVGQSLLMADVFVRQIERHDTDLSILFTNHVASAMHRYWAATFPDDWDAHPYGDRWITEHADELPFAMRATDRIVERLQRLAERTDRNIIVVSSMGQRADLDVDPSRTHTAVVDDPMALLDTLGCEFHAESRPAMVPQLTFVLPDEHDAERFERWATDVLGDALIESMRADTTVTLTTDFDSDSSTVLLGDRRVRPERIGARIEPINDHRSGCHDPRGILASARSTDWPAEVDAFEIGDRILERLGARSPLTTR